jgi:hypothetical protein
MSVQNVNPIFNLLPDILSSLGAEQVCTCAQTFCKEL